MSVPWSKDGICFVLNHFCQFCDLMYMLSRNKGLKNTNRFASKIYRFVLVYPFPNSITVVKNKFVIGLFKF